MEFLAVTAVIFYVVSATALGTRLLRLHHRDGVPPAALLGWSLLLVGPIAQSFALVRTFFEPGNHELAREWLLAGVLAGVGGSITLVARFNHSVYHPRSSFLHAISAGVATITALTIAQRFHPQISVLPLPMWRVFTLVAFCTWAWTAAESLRHWAAYRRVPDLDPLVVDRFRMWGITGFAVMCWALTSYFYGISTLAIGTGAGFGLIAAAGLWLAFLPPHWYRRRLLGEPPRGA